MACTSRHFEGLKPQIPLLESSNLVALPDFSAGAMENWGLITFREGLLLASGLPVPEETSSQLSIIAHELSHQMVTSTGTSGSLEMLTRRHGQG
ncbi:hypothetical protein ANCCEY_13676 [Ancylostoma ceylanicum]|uniref:Peptidase M1 membrane alanine aminopeptidase domain-containing protein n=1 Tax=Ancylostoma ceylanicum TaxID=53326 RepID=A0A0D6LBN1_9BILA|nr:hypothetical protein ANCCEY_13676 [Ancylostoma ceylanicum]